MVKYCPRCGYANSDDAIFCARCGYRLTTVQQQRIQISKVNKKTTSPTTYLAKIGSILSAISILLEDLYLILTYLYVFPSDPFTTFPYIYNVAITVLSAILLLVGVSMLSKYGFFNSKLPIEVFLVLVGSQILFVNLPIVGKYYQQYMIYIIISYLMLIFAGFVSLGAQVSRISNSGNNLTLKILGALIGTSFLSFLGFFFLPLSVVTPQVPPSRTIPRSQPLKTQLPPPPPSLLQEPQPQHQQSNPKITQAGLAFIRNNGITMISLYSEIRGKAISAIIEGANIKAKYITPSTINQGLNNLTIYFGNTSSLKDKEDYSIIITVSTQEGNVINVKAKGVYIVQQDKL